MLQQAGTLARARANAVNTYYHTPNNQLERQRIALSLRQLRPEPYKP